MDILTELRSSFDDLESNPEELKDLETKLDLIYSLYKKHKVESVKELILIKENLHKEINNFENFEDNTGGILMQRGEVDMASSDIYNDVI